MDDPSHRRPRGDQRTSYRRNQHRASSSSSSSPSEPEQQHHPPRRRRESDAHRQARRESRDPHRQRRSSRDVGPYDARRASRNPDEGRRRTQSRDHAAAANTNPERRRGHRARDSEGDVLAATQARRASRRRGSESEREAGAGRRSRRESGAARDKAKAAAPLSLDALAKLDKVNAKDRKGWGAYNYDEDYLKEVRRKEKALEKERVRAKARGASADRRAAPAAEGRRSLNPDDRRRRHESSQERDRRRENQRRRVVSGPLAEEGGVEDDEYQYMMKKRGGGFDTEEEERAAKKKKWKRIAIGVASLLIILAIIIPVGVMLSKNSDDNDSSTAVASTGPNKNNLKGKDPNSVPAKDKGGILDPWSWYDTEDFNVTYTSETVGGLPIIGLNSTWDDDVRANSNVPPLNKKFEYGKQPIRGVNVGGWLNLEPFITPSFFAKYSTHDRIVDEWTLMNKLGPGRAKDTLEKHYATFIRRESFAAIRDAGIDHVRFPFGYWIVRTFGDEPYVPQVAWRYLLRGIEYCRQNGLRVNLDLHGAPGSQNGWNHSGRQGVIGWLNGTDGDLNAQRTLEIHHALSLFFAQPRYKNLVTMYGLVNEPRNVELDTDAVVRWTEKAVAQVREDGIDAVIVFGDGFMGLDNWQGKLQGHKNLLLDVHQYVIFNIDQLSLTHREKLNFACKAWTAQSLRSMDKKTGFGPTMCGEWSQADTDCTQNINNVGLGSRWEGNFNTGNASTAILKPQCPDGNGCSCREANADPKDYSDVYKKWLYQFAIGQMDSFEAGWGWFYWTWETEAATQWSYRRGLEAGILPEKAYDRGWTCPDSPSGLENFDGLSEKY